MITVWHIWSQHRLLRLDLPLHIIANVGPLTMFPPGEAPVDWAPCFAIWQDTEIIHHEATSLIAREIKRPDGSFEIGPMPVRRNGRLCEPGCTP